MVITLKQLADYLRIDMTEAYELAIEARFTQVESGIYKEELEDYLRDLNGLEEYRIGNI